jgi:hypothetical protein
MGSTSPAVRGTAVLIAAPASARATTALFMDDLRVSEQILTSKREKDTGKLGSVHKNRS